MGRFDHNMRESPFDPEKDRLQIADSKNRLQDLIRKGQWLLFRPNDRNTISIYNRPHTLKERERMPKERTRGDVSEWEEIGKRRSIRYTATQKQQKTGGCVASNLASWGTTWYSECLGDERCGQWANTYTPHTRRYGSDISRKLESG